MNPNYVDDRKGTFYVNGSRVVRLFDEGMSPEAIRSEFPTLTLAQVHGAIAFYLDHKGDVEVSIQKADLAEETFRQAHAAPPHLKEKFERARRAKTEIPSRRFDTWRMRACVIASYWVAAVVTLRNPGQD